MLYNYVVIHNSFYRVVSSERADNLNYQKLRVTSSSGSSSSSSSSSTSDDDDIQTIQRVDKTLAYSSKQLLQFCNYKNCRPGMNFNFSKMNECSNILSAKIT